ncbi:MAG: tetratricopeptide repeat protein, partial [Chloroflexota bacterium]
VAGDMPDFTRSIYLASRSPRRRELLAQLARKTNNQGALVEALSRQAQTLGEAGNFGRAKELYEELLKLEPSNPDFTQSLNRIRERMGEPSVVAAPEAAAAPAVVAGELDAETQAYVNSALTEVDLFSSYGMADKAIDLALQVVARAPGHIVAHEKLLDFYVGGGKDKETVETARRLEELHRQKGDTNRAEELAQLASRYEEKLGAAVVAAPTEGAREVDLSAEWSSLGEAPAEEAAVEVAPPAEFTANELREEIGFYIDQGMLNEARMALDRYAGQFPDEPVLAELRERLERVAAPAPAAAAPAPAPVAEEEEEPVAAAPAAEPAVAAAAPEETYEVTLEPQPQQGGPMSAADFFSDLAGEVGAVVAEAAPPTAAAPSKPAAAPVGAGKAESTEGVAALAEVFDEFKQELGAAEQVEDIETHYNLGIAFKEMGLYDEAISEFQKVFKAAEQQKAYSNLIQCCTLLGICFMEKGMPQIAVGWYERALKAPGIDAEGVMAIRYDMGLAHEQAGDRKAALSCFMEVYGLNVDFRNVSERIRELQS